MKKKIKDSKPRKDFSERLAEKLALMNIGDIDTGVLGDKEGKWVDLQVKDIKLHFFFDMKGEKIINVGLYQDVIQKVDERRIIKFESKP